MDTGREGRCQYVKMFIELHGQYQCAIFLEFQKASQHFHTEESFIINILMEGQKVYLSHSMLREHRIDIVDVASSAWWMKISGEKLFFVLRKLNIGLAHQMVGDDNIWRQSYAGEPSPPIIMQWRHSNTRHLHSADTASVWAWYSHSASTWMYPDCLYPSR